MSERERVRAERTAAFFGLYGELSSQSGFEKIGQYAQHGSTTRLVHSVAVAYYSYRLAFFLGLSFHARDLVRGALLHDYFLYDAQDGDPAHKATGPATRRSLWRTPGRTCPSPPLRRM